MPRLGVRQRVQNFFKVRPRGITVALALGFLGGTILSGAAVAQTNEQGIRWYSQDLAGLAVQASGLAEGDAAGLALNWAANAPLSKGGPLSKVGSILADLYHEHDAYRKQSGLKTQAVAFQSKAPLIRTIGDMVVIDTTGASPFDAQEMGALDQLRRSAEIEPLLVLAAGGDAIDSISIAEGFVALGCRRMIATRLDLSHRLGTLLTMAEATGLAFAGVSDTPRIAEGVSPVNPVSLARLILPIREAPAQLLTGTNA